MTTRHAIAKTTFFDAMGVRGRAFEFGQMRRVRPSNLDQVSRVRPLILALEAGA
jgi:hypothetical protein